MIRFVDLKTPWTDPESSELQFCLQHYDYFKDFYRDFHEAAEDEFDFLLHMNHYINDRGNTRNKRTLLKGAELFHVHRHKCSSISRSEPYIDAFARNPADEGAEQAAQGMKALLTQQFYDPLKRYRRNRRKVISGALAARGWGMALEVGRDPNGYMGLMTRAMDSPSRLMPHPGWSDMHDPTCPSVMEECIIRTEDVVTMALARKWENVDKLMPDGTTPDLIYARGKSGMRGITPYNGGPQRGPFMDEYTKLVLWYVKDDHTRGYRNVRERERKRDEPQRICDQCGQTFMPDDMAGQMTAPCPVCEKGVTVPIRFMEAEVVKKYPNGRLWVFAPDLQVVLYNKAWPYDLRSYPYLLYSAYENPREVFGQSDSSLYWGLQVMLNRLRMFGYNQMMNSPDLLIAPYNGLVDSRKRPYVYTDQQGGVAYFTNFQEAQGIKHIQGAGLPNAWSTLHGALTQDFTRVWGISDMGMDAGNSRKIPVGTMQRMIENAELPVDEHVSRFREEESVLWNVGADFMYAAIKAEGGRTVTSDEYGQRKQIELDATSMQPCEIVMSGQPDLRMLKREEIDGLKEVMGSPPWMREEIAKRVGYPLREIQNLTQAEQAFNQQQAMAAGGAPPQPGAGAAAPTEPEPPEWASQMATSMGS